MGRSAGPNAHCLQFLKLHLLVCVQNFLGKTFCVTQTLSSFRRRYLLWLLCHKKHTWMINGTYVSVYKWWMVVRYKGYAQVPVTADFPACGLTMQCSSQCTSLARSITITHWHSSNNAHALFHGSLITYFFLSPWHPCRRFFRSLNFEGWLRYRQQEVNQKLQALHVEALCQAVSISSWCQVVSACSWGLLRTCSPHACTAPHPLNFPYFTWNWIHLPSTFTRV